jgi:hypothetical protein
VSVEVLPQLLKHFLHILFYLSFNKYEVTVLFYCERNVTPVPRKAKDYRSNSAS